VNTAVLRYAIGALLSLSCLSCGAGQSSVPPAPPAPTLVGVWQGSVSSPLWDPGVYYSATIIITEEGPVEGTVTPFKGTYVTDEPGTTCITAGMKSGTVTGWISSVPFDSFGNNIQAAFTEKDPSSGMGPMTGTSMVDAARNNWSGAWILEGGHSGPWCYGLWQHWFSLRKTS